MEKSFLNSQILTQKFSITYADLTSNAGTTGTVTLFTLAQGAKILGVGVKHSTAFSGGSVSACTVSVGKSGAATRFSSAFSVFQAVADTTLQETAMFSSVQHTAQSVIATFTSTTDNLSALTAGVVDIYITYQHVLTPSA